MFPTYVSNLRSQVINNVSNLCFQVNSDVSNLWSQINIDVSNLCFQDNYYRTDHQSLQNWSIEKVLVDLWADHYKIDEKEIIFVEPSEIDFVKKRLSELKTWKWRYGNTPRFELKTDNFNFQVRYYLIICWRIHGPMKNRWQSSEYSKFGRASVKTSTWKKYVCGWIHSTYITSLSPQAKWYVLIWFKYLIPLTCLKRVENVVRWGLSVKCLSQ